VHGTPCGGHTARSVQDITLPDAGIAELMDRYAEEMVGLGPRRGSSTQVYLRGDSSHAV